LVNVNIPALRRGSPRGVKLVRQGTAAIAETYRRSQDRQGRLLLELTDYYEHHPQDGDNDVAALAEGFITVTPLHCDLTDRARLVALSGQQWGDVPM